MSDLSYRPKFENGLCTNTLTIKDGKIITPEVDDGGDTVSVTVTDTSEINANYSSSIVFSQQCNENSCFYETTVDTSTTANNRTTATTSISASSDNEKIYSKINSQTQKTSDISYATANTIGSYGFRTGTVQTLPPDYDAIVTTNVQTGQLKLGERCAVTLTAKQREYTTQGLVTSTYSTLTVTPSAVTISGINGGGALSARKFVIADAVAKSIIGKGSTVDTNGDIVDSSSWGGIGTIGLFKYTGNASFPGESLQTNLLKRVRLYYNSNGINPVEENAIIEGSWYAITGTATMTLGNYNLVLAIRVY